MYQLNVWFGVHFKNRRKELSADCWLWAYAFYFELPEDGDLKQHLWRIPSNYMQNVIKNSIYMISNQCMHESLIVIFLSRCIPITELCSLFSLFSSVQFFCCCCVRCCYICLMYISIFCWTPRQWCSLNWSHQKWYIFYSN